MTVLETFAQSIHQAPIEKEWKAGEKEWKARLSVEIDHQDARSFLKYWSHQGPLRLQRAFYPEGKEVCHLTLLHPPGGIVAGDKLSLDFHLLPNAHSVITTPAAGKFYCSDQQGRVQSQKTQATLAANASLEWFPQENIIFTGANAVLDNRFLLAANANLIGWDINCLGLPAAQQSFDRGYFKQRLQIWRQPSESNTMQAGFSNRPIYIENSLYQGGHTILQNKCGLQGYPIFASFFATFCTKQLNIIRSILAKATCVASVSQMPEILICRYLGHSAEEAKDLFTQVWQIIREEHLHRPTCRPRIWNT